MTLPCSLILSRINHYNAVPRGAPTSIIQIPDTAESSEQHSSDCAPGVEVIPRQAVTAPAALVASPAADHIQVGSSDVQDLQKVHSSLSERPSHGTCLQLNSLFICHPAAGPTVYHDRLYQSCFPVSVPSL